MSLREERSWVWGWSRPPGLLRSVSWAGERQGFLMGEELDQGLLQPELLGTVD